MSRGKASPETIVLYHHPSTTILAKQPSIDNKKCMAKTVLEFSTWLIKQYTKEMSPKHWAVCIPKCSLEEKDVLIFP